MVGPHDFQDIEICATVADLDSSTVSGDVALVQNPLSLYVYTASGWTALAAATGQAPPSPASEAGLGTVELATESEIQNGTAGILVATAARLKAEFERRAPAAATESAAGIAEIATQGEANAATDDARIITPAKLAGTFTNRGLHTDAYCELMRATDQSFGTGVFASVDWNSEVRDPRNWHDNATNPHRVTPGEAGMYLVTAYMAWVNNSTGARHQRIMRGASTTLAQDKIEASTAATGLQTTAVLVFLGASDFVHVEVQQTSGGALAIDSANCRLTVARVV